MRRHFVLRVITKLLMPFVLLFALYVQFHGDFGPGGGFQAGVIFAAGFILYALTFGVDSAQRILPVGILRAGVASGDRFGADRVPPVQILELADG